MEPVKHLTITQVRNLRKLEGDASDHMAIMWSCGCTLDEAREFFDTAPAGEVAAVIARIFELSKMSEAAQFPSQAADDAVEAREGSDD